MATFIFGNEKLFKIKDDAPIIQLTADQQNIVTKKKLSKDLVLISNQLTTDERQLLIKILQVAKVDFKNLEMIFSDQIEEFDFEDLSAVTKVINFGVEMDKLRFSNLYQILRTENLAFLKTDPVTKINQNQNREKNHLWEALQEVFYEK